MSSNFSSAAHWQEHGEPLLAYNNHQSKNNVCCDSAFSTQDMCGGSGDNGGGFPNQARFVQTSYFSPPPPPPPPPAAAAVAAVAAAAAPTLPTIPAHPFDPYAQSYVHEQQQQQQSNQIYQKAFHPWMASFSGTAISTAPVAGQFSSLYLGIVGTPLTMWPMGAYLLQLAQENRQFLVKSTVQER